MTTSRVEFSWVASLVPMAAFTTTEAAFVQDTLNVYGPGAFDIADAQPLHLRPVAILVSPGNRKRIGGFRDRLAPGVKVLTVAGAGRTGPGCGEP